MSRSTALPAGGGRRADLRLLLRGERLARLARLAADTGSRTVSRSAAGTGSQ